MSANPRKDRLDTLALAPADEIVSLWAAFCAEGEPEHTFLREPEFGLVALDGRMGGGGDRFRFGEASASRASVRLTDGRVGHAVALGRDPETVRISALLDAICQDDAMAARAEAAIFQPLRNALRSCDTRLAEETAATKVDFFTMVRGEDAA